MKTEVKTNSAGGQVIIEDMGDRKLVCVDDGKGTVWDLTVFKGQSEPRMSIADVASRVGRPADEIRRLARTWKAKSKNFNPLEVRTKTGVGDTEFLELWCTEAEVLFLCTKLRGETPEDITWNMIHVYMLARRGLLPQQSIDVGTVTRLAESIVGIQETMQRNYDGVLTLVTKVQSDFARALSARFFGARPYRRGAGDYAAISLSQASRF